jgi:Leucine-rich repeat (LRR) protein
MNVYKDGDETEDSQLNFECVERNIVNSMKNYISVSQCNITALSSDIQNSKNISLPTVNKNLKQNVIFKNMSYLTLTDRKITEFPKDLNDLTSPQVLFVERSYLEELPGALGTLIRLAKINASYNQIVDLPRSLGNLNKLTCIDISHNRLQYMPTALNCLECLAILNISHNSISTIETQPHWLHTITILQLQHNKLQYLPRWINEASRLYDLNVSCNPLESQAVIRFVIKSAKTLVN